MVLVGCNPTAGQDLAFPAANPTLCRCLEVHSRRSGSGIPEPQHTRGEEDPVYPLQDSQCVHQTIADAFAYLSDLLVQVSSPMVPCLI